MAPDHRDHDTIFYRFGRGIFLAFLLVTVPTWVVLRYYTQIEAWWDGISAYPVYTEMQTDFHTGSELVGTLFAQKLASFYRSDSMAAATPALPSRLDQAGAHWRRADLEHQLAAHFSGAKTRNAQAYLDYIERYRMLALQEMQRSKIPASVTLAQGLLEADAGRGYLAQNANNHFGVKCMLRPGYRSDGSIDRGDFYHHSLAIDCLQRKDDYRWDHFEVYPSAAESYRRHSLLLQGERYAWMIRQYEVGQMYAAPKKLYRHDQVPYYAAWSLGLKQSGYATAKNYAELLTLIIETYQLWKIDYELVLA
ncbi:MAG TPA: glucosaminidase domain-containing protein [Saprospiraceae bacterium]|nr:glucosaminidase domain-containing protein [Saprospiraceae bacterium]HND89797.1 glucosaminidase domain-containing protein [Saprospiraceae bacterium]